MKKQTKGDETKKQKGTEGLKNNPSVPFLLGGVVRMSVLNFVGAILALLGVVYAVMGFIALSHVDQSKKDHNARMFSPAWYAHTDMLDDFGKRLCIPGRPLFYVVWVGFIAWFIARELIE